MEKNIHESSKNILFYINYTDNLPRPTIKWIPVITVFITAEARTLSGVQLALG